MAGPSPGTLTSVFKPTHNWCRLLAYAHPLFTPQAFRQASTALGNCHRHAPRGGDAGMPGIAAFTALRARQKRWRFARTVAPRPLPRGLRVHHPRFVAQRRRSHARILAMQAHTAYAAQAAAVQAPRPSDTSVAMPALYSAALGPLNAERYLAFFQRQDDTGRTLPGWNAAAAFSTLGWMVFRQLWAPALVYLAALEGVALLLFALGHQWLALPLPILGGVALAFFGAACVLPGIYGDAAMHAEVRKKITRAVTASANLTQAAELLTRQAPTRRRLVWVAGVHAALAASVLVLWLAFPNSFRPTATNDGHNLQPTVAASNAAVASVSPTPALPHVSASTVAQLEIPASAAAAAETATAVPPSSGSSAELAAPTRASAPATTAPAPKAAAAPAVAADTANTTQGRAVAAPTTAMAARSPDVSPPAAAASAATPSSKPASTSRAARPATAPAKASQTAASKAAASDEPPRRQLYINAGLFGEPDNARRAHALLLKAGLPASTAPVKSSGGRMLTRVRAGPFASTSEANAAMAQVQLLGLEAAPAQK